jgi:Zn-dependent metalloprotease
LPPYVLRAVVQNGTKAQRDAALATLSVDSTFRATRAYLAATTPPDVRRRRRIGLGPSKQRTIATAKNQQTLPGRLARGEGSPATGDAAVDEAYEGLGHTFDFFWENYQRNSIDDEGLPLSATVHYGKA